MTEQQCLEQAREYANRVWSERDNSIIDILFADSFSIESPTGVVHQGNDAKDYLKAVNQNWFDAFPDLVVTWDSELVSEEGGNVLVTQHWHAQGTHENAFFCQQEGEQVSYPATNNTLNYAGETSYLFNSDAKIIRYQARLIDSDSFYQQLAP